MTTRPAPGPGDAPDRLGEAAGDLDAREPWAEAALVARLLALDPAGSGARLVGRPGPARDRWLSLLRGLLPPGAPWRRLPLGATPDRLLGGLDLAATLRAGRPVAGRGLLAEANGGALLAASAERLDALAAAHLAAALDLGEAVLERDGLVGRAPARLALLLLDEGEGEEAPPPALLARLPYRLDLDALGAPLGFADPPDRSGPATPPPGAVPPTPLADARARLPGVSVPDEVVSALCAAALALGLDDLRAPLMAARAARGLAALADRDAVSEGDAALAARLVLAPRALALPAPPAEAGEDPPPPSEGEAGEEGAGAEEASGEDGAGALDSVVLEAVRAALPPGLLERAGAAGRGPAPAGRSAAARRPARRGRPCGTRPGPRRPGDRLALAETLRAAAPWQPLRRAPGEGRVRVRPEDLRLLRFRDRPGASTVFAVDASGSAALHRLAEAKGAVEHLLAEGYARRDRVSLIAFGGAGARLLLPPTHALARARRLLAGLPGGGGTPLAAGLEAALLLALSERREGRSPLVVLITDGRANLARDGAADRGRAEAEALDLARRMRAAGLPAVVVDSSPRPGPAARGLAGAMGARYLPLPRGGPAALSRAVRAGGAA